MLKRVHALESTFSGIAAEARVAAELVRCGLRVAKPYWTDDEVDLLVLHHDFNQAILVPLQVKSVQFLSSKSREAEEDRFVSKLKKRYIEKNPALCLAVYRPDLDLLWFIDGPENIIRVYDQDAMASKRTRYADLASDDDVRIRVTHSKCSMDTDWLVPRDDAAWLSGRIKRIADSVIEHNRQIAQLGALWDNPEDG